MLRQTQAALVAVQVVDNSEAVQGIAAAVAGLSAGALPGEVARVLPADASGVLDNALTLAAYATPNTLTAINLAAYSATSNDVTVSSNTVPVISGSPAASVTANSGYAFQPSTSDADGDTLTFSIVNKPRWALFDSSTGRLYGTPGDADVGTYDRITISASDGEAVATLPAFSIRVDAQAGSTGSFSLSWNAPVARADGTPLSLSDIDGYRIYFGDKPGSYTSNVNIADGRTLSATINNVSAGSYYVVMTTYDITGLESGYSAEIVKQANY
jgi:hypothetical protein